ncbi:MAG: cupin domain-containing protein [Nitrospirota bacterium]|nr:cupin domain-containing protein [Nitrospirota bacterium]
MIVRRLNECEEFLAGDHTHLRELLHPARSPVKVGYSLAHGKLAPGAHSKRHRLSSSEVYYFLAGRGMFHIDGQSSLIEPDLVVYVPPGAEQWVENPGDSTMEFLCLVDPAWKHEDEHVLE